MTIVMVPALVLMHWGWCKLQDVEALVKKEEKKDLPIVIGAQHLAHVVEEKWQTFRGGRKSSGEE